MIMMYQRRATAPVLSFLVAWLCFSPPAWSWGESVARVTRVRGEVLCSRPGMGGARRLTTGSPVQVADTLESGANSRLQLLLNDDSVISISPGAVVRISQFSFDRGNNRRSAVVTIIRGAVRFIVQGEHRDGSSFRIQAGQTLVQTAQADLVVEAAGKQTVICVLSGSAGVRNSSNLVIGNVRVGENSCSLVGEKSPPTNPTPISAQQRGRYIRDARTF